MCMDIHSFYLNTPLKRFEYMRFPIELFPQHIIEQYNLLEHVLNGFVYVEIRKAIYGLPQAGILANKLLKKRLRPEGYYEVAHTPGLWKHVTRPICFTLVVDDFGVKYTGEEHAQHLIKALQKTYKISIDWTGSLYCGISLDWNYEKGYVDIAMLGYVIKLLARYKHIMTKKQYSPYPVNPKKYGKDAQLPIPCDDTPILNAADKKEVEQIVGSVLYYARAVDLTTLVGLSSIASQQAKATATTHKLCRHMLDYLATNPTATIRYYASKMILNIHSDASYLSEPNAKSRASGHFS